MAVVFLDPFIWRAVSRIDIKVISGVCKHQENVRLYFSVFFFFRQILHLASLLQISGSDESARLGRVLMLVAESAIEARDYRFAYETCKGLISQEYVPAWTICR